MRVSLALCLVAGTSTHAIAQGPDLLGDLMAQMAQVRARDSRFTEERHFSALNQPLVSQGQLLFRRPAHFEKITVAPQQERLVVDGDQLTVTSADGSQRQFALDSEPQIASVVDAIRAPLMGDIARLRQHFRVEAQGSETAWRLVLSPLGQDVGRILRSITIDGSQTSVRVIDILQVNGDNQRMTIQDAS